jgi:SAM-dependent methyltransferase
LFVGAIFIVLLLFLRKTPVDNNESCAGYSCVLWDRFKEFGLPFPGSSFGQVKTCKERPPKELHEFRKRLFSLVFPENCFMYDQGIELGALHQAAELPDRCKAKRKFVDKFTLDQLRKTYPELHNQKLNPPDILDDATTLLTIKNGEKDFVVAMHILEHLPNPLSAVESWVRVTRGGGLIVIGIPNKCLTFDKYRAVTSLKHLLEEYRNPEKVDRSLREHEREGLLSEKLLHETTPQDLQKRIKEGESEFSNVAVNFHTWDEASFEEMADFIVQELPVRQILRAFNGMDMILALEKEHEPGDVEKNLERRKQKCKLKQDQGWKLDPTVYRMHNSDLLHLTLEQLEQHYWIHGCIEGRRASD